MRAVSRKRAALAPQRAAAERALGRGPDGMGICARCGQWTYVNGHERLGRSQGGDPAKPDCLVCVPCNQLFEDYPVWAALYGWKISRKHPRNPDLQPNEAWDRMGELVTFGVTV